MSSVKLQPWKGKKYRLRKPRLLVVGESHYDWPHRRVRDYDATRKVMRDDIAGYTKGGITPRYTATCLGHWPTSLEELGSFLHEISFYNYVQVILPNRWTRPTREQWQGAAGAFEEVLRSLKPQLILVLGVETWKNLPRSIGTAGKPLPKGEGQFTETWLYPIGRGKTALAFHIKHPARAYNFRKFAPLFKQAQLRVQRLNSLRQRH